MAPTPYLVDCLVQLRTEFNQQNFGRDKASDGWIGDAAHQGRQSDHNPDALGRVKAIDVDTTGPWPRGNDAGDYAEFLRVRHRNGQDDRLEYIIHNRHICSLDSSWEWELYGGTDPHIEHIHFSARHDNHGGTDSSAWQLGEVGTVAHDPLDTTDAQTVWTKGGADARNATSGFAIGIRAQVNTVVDPRFDAIDTALQSLAIAVGNLQAQMNVVSGWDLSADARGGDPSEAQEQIAEAVWNNPTRTTTA